MRWRWEDCRVAFRVFLSYRRGVSDTWAGRLYDHLTGEFGEENVFFDVDNIDYGEDFRSVIRDYLEQVSAVVAVVGPDFASARLADPNDFVRLELLEALAQEKLLVPVLVANAQMPTPDMLPAELQALCYRNAARLRVDPDFRSDAQRLIASLRRRRAPQPNTASATAPEMARTPEAITAPEITNARTSNDSETTAKPPAERDKAGPESTTRATARAIRIDYLLLGAAILLAVGVGASLLSAGIFNLVKGEDEVQTPTTIARVQLIFGILVLLLLIPLGIWLRTRIRRDDDSASMR
jgi:hypothetical protein